MNKEKRRKTLVWKIDLKKKPNTRRFVWFCIFAFLIVLDLILALIIVAKGTWQAGNTFLIAFPIVCLIINFFIGRAILLTSQPEDI